MSYILADRIFKTTSTTGTGAIALNGPSTDYWAFASIMATGNTCPYVIGTPGGAIYEAGIATMQANGTLARTSVQISSNNNVLANLPAGMRDIYLSALANASYLRKDGDSASAPITITSSSATPLTLTRAGTTNVSINFASGAASKFLGINTDGVEHRCHDRNG